MLSIVLVMGALTNQRGLPVSLMVALAGVLGSMPRGVLLALGRRARELQAIHNGSSRGLRDTCSPARSAWRSVSRPSDYASWFERGSFRTI
jgi:hypothetical protein